MAPRPSATRRSHGSRARSTRRAFLEDGSVLHHHAAAAQGMTCQGIPAAAGYTPHRGSDAPERAIDRNGGPMAETAAAGTAPPDAAGAAALGRPGRPASGHVPRVAGPDHRLDGVADHRRGPRRSGASV